jgi:uncharacterized Ntn-hydrolase superfamily protein
MGCAVTTSSVCVGARCGRVGPDCVVFSQARTDPRLHQVGLDSYAETGDPDAALGAMQAAAVSPHWRQLGLLDRAGRARHFTGASCLPVCGGAAGNGCLALGNYLGSDEVLPAMLAGFESAGGPLAVRLMAGLAAGFANGGERDPLQSAALLVFADQAFAYADLRIDKSSTPIADLEALWQDWAPKADAYVIRTLDPDAAPPSHEIEALGGAPKL